jgi:hypothetical protein
MGKTIINVSNQFFEMDGKEGDVLYSFTGRSGPISSDNVLYGKTVNLSEMYDTMLDDVREFLFGGEFVDIIHKSSCGISGGMPQIVNAYTSKKHGISIEWVYNKIHINTADTNRVRSAGMMTTDIIFNELKVKFGTTEIDWMYLYNNVIHFRTNDVEILDYIGNRILSNDIYEYFVDEYNLRTVCVVKKVKPRIKNNISVDKSSNFIKLEWNNGGNKNKDVALSNLMRSYNHCWMNMTNSKNRGNIRDYDVLLNGRSVTEVFPVYCPVFTNLRLNYTGIDFDGKSNIKKCSEIAGYSDMGETWSFASIDRIDSSKGYSYDNIRIISQYANTLKNMGSNNQIIILGKYLKNNE